jgi:hypothetical protein
MRGSLLDVPIIGVILLSGAITIFVVVLMLNAINNAWPVAGESKAVLTAGVNSFRTFDYMFVIVAVGLGCFSIISAFFIKSHPAFYIISAILLIPVTVLGAAQITNVFMEFASSGVMVATANAFPYIVTFMQNFPTFCLVISILIAIAMYAKPESGPGGGV